MPIQDKIKEIDAKSELMARESFKRFLADGIIEKVNDAQGQTGEAKYRISEKGFARIAEIKMKEVKKATKMEQFEIIEYIVRAVLTEGGRPIFTRIEVSDDIENGMVDLTRCIITKFECIPTDGFITVMDMSGENGFRSCTIDLEDITSIRDTK